MKKQDFFVTLLSSVAFRLGGPGPPGPPPGYAYYCNFSAICDIRILCAFLPLCACQCDTNGSISYDHAKYVI